MSSFPYPVPQQLLSAIKDSQKICLLTHERPDNDGFGSLLALAFMLESMGKNVLRVDHGTGPDAFAELPGFEKSTLLSDVAAPIDCDLVILLDCHRLARTGAAAKILRGNEKVFIIDHHPIQGESSVEFPYWIIEEAPATSCLVQSLPHAIDEIQLNEAMSRCLFAALLTDTGGFRFSNTNAVAFAAASELVAAGAEPASLAEKFLFGKKRSALSLMCKVVGRAEYLLDDSFAVIEVLHKEMQKFGVGFPETEGWVQQVNSVRGVKIAAFMKEEADGSWRVSLRAKANNQVRDIARSFGGGGHMRAAAFHSNLKKDDLLSQLHAAVQRELEGGGNV